MHRTGRNIEARTDLHKFEKEVQGVNPAVDIIDSFCSLLFGVKIHCEECNDDDDTDKSVRLVQEICNGNC